MKFIYFTCFYILSLGNTFFSQEEEYITTNKNTNSFSLKERIYTGGNFGFNISNGLMYLEIAPMLGYKITDNLSAGISGKYLFWGPTSKSSNFVSYKYYGGGLFGRYRITESIFASAEYELLNVQDLNPNSSSFKKRIFSNIFLLGGGYINEIADNIYLQLYLLYDVIDDPNSPYRNNYIFGPNGVPITYRIGFSIGL